jgi:putative membrane-bound dehydrogenase-like protein
MSSTTFLAVLFLSGSAAVGQGKEPLPGGAMSVGVARVDVTPDYPVRLSGFLGRNNESEGVRQKIHAKALAFGSDNTSSAVLIAVDNLAIPDRMVTELAARLEKKAGLDPRRLAVTFTHTHTAPMLSGVLPTLFGKPIPPEHQENIDRYTRELADRLEQVALAALRDRQPARLSWGVGKVDLAINRRTKDGPVDHELPVLVVRDLAGKIRAIYLSYACHCVTLSDNRISGDWAGYAQEHIERLHPGAVALVSAGCGADSNPRSGVTGDKGDVAEAQGIEFATEIERLLKEQMRPVTGPITTHLERIDLAFDKLPTREEFAEKGKLQDPVGFHARTQLARLDRGEALRERISYPIQTWTFGDSLAMVFLPGEVVVDYSLRLKRELDSRRLWINAYSNDAPCYIPSERILKEGGYEGGGAMVYYDQPTKLAAGLEQQIVDAVRRQIGEKFKAPVVSAKDGSPRSNRAPVNSAKSQGAQPLSPVQSLAAMRTKPGLTVELVAAEPLVASPVAIDFGPDGKLWIAEMTDYPLGLDGNYQPGGRVRMLESSRGDGHFDKASVFLDGIPFPTGVTVWRKGVLVCAAPDILYAEDTNGDGKADQVRKLFSGFGTDNFQARVNSLEYGLDGWVYGSCGLFGGQITNDAGKPVVALGDRDFRIKPDEGIIEPATGRTQQGRVRDDWDNWFGCDNSNLGRHYPLADQYLRRNPHFAPEGLSTSVPEGPDPNRVYPLGRLQLFKLSGPAGRATAACGLGIYRDDLLGSDYRGNAFTCEPVNLVVHRMLLEPQGFAFTGRRAADELQSEFVASADNWFRPVQARTGPDGALWIVDMYRYIIEHPRWIPPEDLVNVDVRAGHDMGRIYRVRPQNRQLRPWVRLDRLDANGLVGALDSPNGWQRDMAAQILVWNNEQTVTRPLEVLVAKGKHPETRLSALCVLDRLGRLRSELIGPLLTDAHAGIRRHSVRLAERFVNVDPTLGPALIRLAHDAEPQVRLQLACSLGEWRDPRAGAALVTLLLQDPGDPVLVSAFFSSLRAVTIAEVIARVLQKENHEGLAPRRLEQLFGVAAALGDKPTLSKIVADVCAPRQGKIEDWQLTALTGIYDALQRRGRNVELLVDNEGRLRMAETARLGLTEINSQTSSESRLTAEINLLSRVASPDDQAALRQTMIEDYLPKFLAPDRSPALQAAAASALGRLGGDEAAHALTAGWRTYTPALKTQVIDLLLSRESWQTHLLETVVPTEIDATRRQRLLSSRIDAVRNLAEQRFAGAPSPDRKQVLDDYRDVAGLNGDRERGRAVFLKSCSACHWLDNAGHSVGPDLAVVANKTPQYLLQEILDPNRNVDSRYVSYIAVTKQGRTLTGLLSAESAGSITLKGQEGKLEVILRSDLEELASSTESLMPVGLEKDLSKQNLADLIAYLNVVGPRSKPFAGNSPELLRPARGRVALLATNAEIFGDAICFETPFRNIGYWHGAKDHVVWTIELERPGQFGVWLDWACDDSIAGNPFTLSAGNEELHGTVPGTGGWDRYQQRRIGQITLPAGTWRVSLYPEGRLNGALMDLRGVYLAELGTTPDFVAVDERRPDKSDSPADAANVARQILDDSRPVPQREALIRDHLDQTAPLVAAMTIDLAPDPKEEYRRIPWIWRVAIAAGRKNETDSLRKLLDASLPKIDEPLRDWQAVVVGGGIINGVSQQGVWPLERMQELLKDQPELTKRWRQMLAQAAKMADDEKIPTGTRYDALRIIPLAGWKLRGDQLMKYLKPGVNDELQMGAISGASDVDAPEVGRHLADGLGHFSPGNRSLAIGALLRTEARTASLVEALEQKRLKVADLKDPQVQKLRKLKDEKLRSRALKVLSR